MLKEGTKPRPGLVAKLKEVDTMLVSNIFKVLDPGLKHSKLKRDDANAFYHSDEIKDLHTPLNSMITAA